jgi:hypothetical protein
MADRRRDLGSTQFCRPDFYVDDLAGCMPRLFADRRLAIATFGGSIIDRVRPRPLSASSEDTRDGRGPWGWPVIFAVAFDAKHSSSMSTRSAHHYVGEWHVIRIERLALLYSKI